MQYMVAGMMFGQGNYLAHYGRKGMKWGENIFGDDYEGGKRHTSAPSVSTSRGSNPYGVKRTPNKRVQQNSLRPSGSIQPLRPGRAESSSSPWLRNYYATTRPVRGAMNAARIGVPRAAESAYRTARGYVNRGIDAVSNRDEYVALQEAIASRDQGWIDMATAEYNDHWMTRAQQGIQRGTDFVRKLFNKISGAVQDAAGKAVAFAQQKYSEFTTKAREGIEKGKAWIKKTFLRAKGLVNRATFGIRAQMLRNRAVRRNEALKRGKANFAKAPQYSV